jgi:hypothetical protein
MKNRDIQNAVKNNGLHIMNSHDVRLMLLSLRPIIKQNIPKYAARKALQFT